MCLPCCYLPVTNVARNRIAVSPEIAEGVLQSAILVKGFVPEPSVVVMYNSPFALVVPVTYRNTYPSAIVSDEISTSMGGSLCGQTPAKERTMPSVETYELAARPPASVLPVNDRCADVDHVARLFPATPVESATKICVVLVFVLEEIVALEIGRAHV